MKQQLGTTPYKGTRDFYPKDMEFRNWMFGEFKKILKRCTYQEYNGPLLEPLALYAAKSGVELVTEQTYNFIDKGGRHMAIRPEMTPTVSRMVAAKVNELNFPVRWFSIANFHRYERPQKGRLREHYQINVDLFGSDSIYADFEVLSLIVKVLKHYGATSEMFKIRINNRRFFNDVLSELTNIPKEKHIDLSKIIDRKEKIDHESYIKMLQDLGLDMKSIQNLERMENISLQEAILICKDSRGAKELQELFEIINKTELNEYCEFDFSIVRGLDYYTGTVFEVYDKSQENKRALFGGGRYDSLVSLFGIKQEIPGVGFGCGDVTLENFLRTHNLIPNTLNHASKLMILRFPNIEYKQVYDLANELRENIACSIFLENKKIGKQIDYAVRENYDYVALLGEDEIKNNTVIIKNLKSREQTIVKRLELSNFFKNEKIRILEIEKED